MIVSVCVVAYNEEEYLPKLFNDFMMQTYDHHKIEIILINSCSTDTTKKVMLDFKESNHDFYNVEVFDNPKKKQASGWNIAISNAHGDAISRIDAHTHIPKEFVENNVNRLLKDEFITGGIRPNIIDGETNWKHTLLAAESSLFGSGIAPYRRNHTKMYVDSAFHATYKREVFENIGGLNENLGRTEDNELHYRMRKVGYRFCLDPSIISYQHTRNTLKGMLKQKFGNGYWIGLTTGISPECLSMFHFVPFVFTIVLYICSIFALFGMGLPLILLLGIYMLCAIFFTAVAIRNEKGSLMFLTLPIIFFLLHVCYGTGTLCGLIKMPFWRKEHKVCEEIENVRQAVIKNKR